MLSKFSKDFLYFKIDRKKKILVTTLLQALGYSKNDIVNEFYKKENYVYDTKIQKWKTKFDPENYKAKNFSEEIINAKNNKVVVKIGEKINFLTAKKFFFSISRFLIFVVFFFHFIFVYSMYYFY